MDSSLPIPPQHSATDSAGPLARIWRYRRYWRGDLLIALILIAISIVLSSRTIDLGIARWFFGRHPMSGWPPADQQPWQWLYDAPPVILAMVIPGCMVALFLSAVGRCSVVVRIRAIYLILALWLGAGLLVEGVFKINWGRPKPAQLSEFGGWLDFHSALIPGVAGRGRSFPSGHSTIGFYLTAFYFVLRRDHKFWSVTALLGGLGAGLVIGLARLRVGGHFSSDVAWSAAIMYLVNLVVYYALLNVPAYEDERVRAARPRRPWGSIVLLVLIPVAIHALVLTFSPVYHAIYHEAGSTPPPEAVQVFSGGCDVELTFTDNAPLRVEGELRGRGLLGASYGSSLTFSEPDGVRMATLLCTRSGWFFQRGGLIRVRLPSAHVTRLTLDTAGATIRFAPGSVMPSRTVIDIRSGTFAQE